MRSVGGALSGTIGIGPTFLACGGAFALNAAGTRFLTSETMRAPPAATAASDPPSGTAGASANAPTPLVEADAAPGPAGGFGLAVAATLRGWVPLWRHDELRGVLIVNGCYWFCLAGANMTLLPLMLASERFGLGPAEIGGLFAMQSAISVVGAMPSAALSDRVGPANVLAPSLLLTALSIGAFPLAADLPQAAGVLCTWALGGVLLGSAPTANAANLAPPEQRAQALALMRTTGDLGLLTGSITIGTVATIIGSDAAMQGTAGALLTSAAWFGMRRARMSAAG